MLSRLEGTLDLVGSSDHREGQILISDSHLHDAVQQGGAGAGKEKGGEKKGNKKKKKGRQ